MIYVDFYRFMSSGVVYFHNCIVRTCRHFTLPVQRTKHLQQDKLELVSKVIQDLIVQLRSEDSK